MITHEVNAVKEVGYEDLIMSILQTWNEQTI
jgi:hypothetical protein